MVRDCRKWRKCLSVARETRNYSLDRALSTIVNIYNFETAERLEKSMLVDMVYELMLAGGLDARRQDADKVVEDWYNITMV